MPDQPVPSEAIEPHTERDQHLLRQDIEALFPTLWKTDASPQLASLLNIIARAKTMGRDGYDMLKAFAERLKQNRAFDDLYILTSEMNADGLDTPKTRHLEIQALVELGVFETALDLVRPLLVGSVTDPDETKARSVREAYGLVGRIYKQMFVDASKPERRTEPEALRLYLTRSFNAYIKVWQELQTVETTYQGVNALAVAQMAQAAGLAEPEDAAESETLARKILDVIAAAKTPDVWAEATRGEALVALGKYDEAAQAYAAFADHPQVDPFSLGASLRQLEEIWRLKGDDAQKGKPVRILKSALLGKVDSIAAAYRAANRAPAELPAERVRMSPREIRLADSDLASMPMPVAAAPAADGVTGASPEALQKTYGLNSPIGRKAIRRKLQLSSAVCRICGPRDGVVQGMATGFAIRGDLLHESFGPGPVIVTNNHVISTRGTMGARRPDLCTAIFMSDTEEEDQPVKFEAVLWESDIDAHDVTILRPKGDLPAGVVPLTELMGGSLGPRAQDDNGIGRCYVIGFPLAKELSFSLADNILLDHDAPAGCAIEMAEGGKRVCKGVPPNPIRVHYRTPTMEGNSGSPVFDADTITLLGVHHAGARDMKRLNGKSGTYAANEGIWIDSIREAIAASLANGATEAAGVAPHWGMVPLDAPVTAGPPPIDPGELVMPAAAPAARLIVPGYAGDPIPGVSAFATEMIYPPGKATDQDRRAAQLETVIGVDNRTRVMDTQMAPWRMICAIRARWGSRLMVGTGCFIGPNTVLTAGHVVYARDFQRFAQHIEVIPGLSAGRTGDEKRPYGSATGTAMFAHDNWKTGFSPRFDVAVIRLDQPLGQRVGWFGMGACTRDELMLNWAHVTGYPGEMKEERAPGESADRAPVQAAQLWHHAAPIEDIDNGRLFYKTDTTPGQSGAPVYVLPEAGQYGTPQIVGVHAYGTRSTPGAIGLANSGVWIDADMLTKIQAWSTH